MTLLEEWKKIEQNSAKRSREQMNAFWQDFFQKEKSVYDALLTNLDEKVSGTVSELADRFHLTAMEMTGFLDGINDSLVEKNPLETMDENTVVSLEFDKERLFRNMVDADAEWLYGLPQWEEIFGAEKKKEIFLDQRKSHTIRVGKKIGRNDPCPCGSGRKYKHCHGKKGAEPLPPME